MKTNRKWVCWSCELNKYVQKENKTETRCLRKWLLVVRCNIRPKRKHKCIYWMGNYEAWVIPMFVIQYRTYIRNNTFISHHSFTCMYVINHVIIINLQFLRFGIHVILVINQFAPEAVLTRKFFLCRRSESVLTRISIFACSGGWLVNTPPVVWHKSGWRVYTHLLLGVDMTTAKWFRTIGSANNEWVHSLCWYLPNPFIEHLFFWRSRHGFVKTDL